MIKTIDQILGELKRLSDQAQLLFINVNEMRDKVMELYADNLHKDFQIERLRAEVEQLKSDLEWRTSGEPPMTGREYYRTLKGHND